MDAVAPDIWQRLLHRSPADAELCPRYGPLLSPPTAPDGCFVLGRLAQSLDGRIATATGESRWISGHADIVHTHRLRALFDAVVVGAGTVRADNPQLTTRLVAGPSPVRVVLDPNRRLDPDHCVFRGPPETLLLCADDAPGDDGIGTATVLRLPRATRLPAEQQARRRDPAPAEPAQTAPAPPDPAPANLERARHSPGQANTPAANGLDIQAVLTALATRGLRRIFVEGGGVTVSRFLAAGALDRLHVTIAPLVLGSGIPAFTLPPARLPDSLRFDWTVHRIGNDVLMDIPLVRSCRAGPV
jgi:riboflavin biosynthesis pyrimidine reductase